MKTPNFQNHPSAYGFLAGLLTFLCGLVLACCTRDVRGRDAGLALESAVRITSTCMAPDGVYVSYGSGVIVNDHTILTAAHVAADTKGMVCIRSATMSNGSTYMLLPHKALPAQDLASLQTVYQRFAPTHPVELGSPPAYGSRVCAMVAFPYVLWRCGETQRPVSPPGDLVHTIIIDSGNSGAGVYDTQGRLFGIITHRWSCANGQICGGKLATLADHFAGLL